MITVEDAWERLLAAHDRAGSPFRSYLAPPAGRDVLMEQSGQLGLSLPDSLVELYEIADGVDSQRWRFPVPPRLLPGGPEFPSVTEAAKRTVELREAAREVPAWSEMSAGRLWHEGWFAAFPIRDGETVAVDCVGNGGEVWLAWWEAADIRRVFDDLGAFLDAAATRFEALGAVWREDQGLFDVDYGLMEELGHFP